MDKKIKQFVKFILRKEYRQELRRKEIEGTIEIVSKPKNATEKVMILKRDNIKVGTFSDYIVFLRMIENALEMNYTPIIDRKTVKNCFFPADEDINTWDVFFEQPCNLRLEDINENMEVSIFHAGGGVLPIQLMECKQNDIINFWRGLSKKYIRFKRDFFENLKQQEKKLLLGKKVLGVSVREGYMKLNDKKNGVLYGHPRQMNVEDTIKLAAEYMSRWDCSDVFFTCQTSETKQAFEEKFGEHAISVDRERPRYRDLLEGDSLKYKTYEMALENEKGYITEIYLLSRCNSLLCSKNSGSEAAFIMSDGFENFKCIDIGTYC